jgi:hypothetical protein
MREIIRILLLFGSIAYICLGVMIVLVAKYGGVECEHFNIVASGQAIGFAGLTGVSCYTHRMRKL